MNKAGTHNKIGLLHLVQGLRVGGAEVLLLHYIKALGTERYRHCVYCFGHDGHIRQRLEGIGILVRIGPGRESIKKPVKFGISVLSLIKDLLRFIRDQRIHIIQSHLGHANQLGVAVGILAGVPAFVTVHNTMAFVDRRSVRDVRVHLIKALNAVIYRAAVQVIAVSQEIKQIIQGTYGLSDSKVIALKNGIVFENSSCESVSVEREFKVSQNRLKLIAVGSLTYQKAFEVLLRAVAEVVKQGLDDFIVLIAGEGRDRKGLEELIRDLGIANYVRLLGLRHDVMGLMKASDIFVMPSRYEGLSIAMIEAMACGLPVVASDAPGLRDYIENGENGLLFPLKDHMALAQHIVLLATDKKLRIRLSLEARKSFEREYDMRKNITSVDLLFRRYASGR